MGGDAADDIDAAIEISVIGNAQLREACMFMVWLEKMKLSSSSSSSSELVLKALFEVCIPAQLVRKSCSFKMIPSHNNNKNNNNHYQYFLQDVEPLIESCLEYPMVEDLLNLVESLF